MSDALLPSSAACERNREPILARLRILLSQFDDVLEIGSGTAEHAVYFAAAMPWLKWTCSDLQTNHGVIEQRIAHAAQPNLHGPLELDAAGRWPQQSRDAVFSANTAHIMPWATVESMFAGVGSALCVTGRFVLYGPFHYNGRPTSRSNAAFDHELQSRGGGEGIRTIEAVHALAAENGLQSLADMAMPANNRLLVWEKSA